MNELFNLVKWGVELISLKLDKIIELLEALKDLEETNRYR